MLAVSSELVIGIHTVNYACKCTWNLLKKQECIPKDPWTIGTYQLVPLMVVVGLEAL